MMTPDCEEINRSKLSSTITDKNGLVISQFAYDPSLTNLKDLITCLKDVRKKLNDVLTDKINSEIDGGAGDAQTLGDEVDEDDDDDDGDDESKVFNQHVRKRKTSEPDKGKRPVKTKL